MTDTVHVVNCVDPVKAFEVLAKIIGNNEGMEITLERLKKRSIENKEETG